MHKHQNLCCLYFLYQVFVNFYDAHSDFYSKKNLIYVEGKTKFLTFKMETFSTQFAWFVSTFSNIVLTCLLAEKNQKCTIEHLLCQENDFYIRWFFLFLERRLVDAEVLKIYVFK